MSALATVRAELGVLLQTALPRWIVFPPDAPTEDVRKPTLVLYRSRVAPHPRAGLGFHQNEFALWLVLPQGSGEDALDDALEELIEALETGTQTRWDEAVRDAYAERQFPAYRLTLSTPSKRS